jgi:hypothetical protein
MSSNVRLISVPGEYGEYSRSIARADGTRLDICCFLKDRQIAIAVVDEDDMHVEEIVFSSEELAVLKHHLNDPEVVAILGGGNVPMD